MSKAQTVSLMLIAFGIFLFWLELNCKTGAFVHAIYDGPGFIQFVVALLIFVAILSVIGEPYSTWFASLVILGMVYIDHEKNGQQDIWRVLSL